MHHRGQDRRAPNRSEASGRETGIATVFLSGFSMNADLLRSPTTLWLLVLVAGAGLLAGRWIQSEHGFGLKYVTLSTQEVKDSQAPPIVRMSVVPETTTGAVFSPLNTFGLWLAVLLTLGIMSSLLGDNPLYKFCESLLVGVSAGYAAVVAFWEVIVGSLLTKLTPLWMQYAFVPGISKDQTPDYWLLIPVVLGFMLLARLIPRFGWMSRWPLAVIIGSTAGLKLVLFVESDLIAQIHSTILPLVAVVNDRVSWTQSLMNAGVVCFVLCSLSYFIFSVPPKGIIGIAARMGIYVLMVTFGASFAYTVMGRITLLTLRLKFLLGDWLDLLP